MCSYWRNKVINSECLLFDTTKNEETEIFHYQRLVATHIVNKTIVGSKTPIELAMIASLFSPVQNSLLATEFNFSDLSKTLLKVLPRPFASFDSEVREVVLRFFIVLTSYLIPNARDLISEKPEYVLIDELSQKLKDKLSLANDTKLIKFLLEYVLEGLCDLKSTYILRPEVVKRLIPAIENSQNKKDNYMTLAALIKRSIDTFSDESRSIRFGEDFLNGEFGIANPSKEYSQFLDLLYVENCQVLYKGVEELYKHNSDKKATGTENEDITGEVVANSYFMAGFRKDHQIQYEKLFPDGEKFDEWYEKLEKVYVDFYETVRKAKENPNANEKYETLFSEFNNIIANSIPGCKNVTFQFAAAKEQDSTDLLPIATSGNDVSDVYAIQSILVQDKVQSELNLRGYIVSTDLDCFRHKLLFKFWNPKEYKTITSIQRCNEDLFGRSLDETITLYLYIEFTSSFSKAEQKDYCNRIIARNLLQYRHSLMKLFESDFTSDAFQELVNKKTAAYFALQERAIVHASNQVFDGLLMSANNTSHTHAPKVLMLLYVNLMVGRLFREKLRELYFKDEMPPLLFTDSPASSYCEGAPYTLWHLFESALFKTFNLKISSNQKQLESEILENRLKLVEGNFDRFFSRFDICDKFGQSKNSDGLIEHMKSFHLPFCADADEFISGKYGTVVVFALLLNAVKHCHPIAIRTDEKIQEYFTMPSKGDNPIKIKLYADDVPDSSKLQYLVIENKAYRIGDKSVPSSKSEKESLIEDENTHLERSLDSPLTSVYNSAGNTNNFDIKLSHLAAHLFCSRILDSFKINDHNQKFIVEYYLEELSDDVYFRAKLPILIKEE